MTTGNLLADAMLRVFHERMGDGVATGSGAGESGGGSPPANPAAPPSAPDPEARSRLGQLERER